MLRFAPLKELPIKSYFQDILHESENLCYHIDDPVVMYVFKIVRYIWRQYGILQIAALVFLNKLYKRMLSFCIANFQKT